MNIFSDFYTQWCILFQKMNISFTEKKCFPSAANVKLKNGKSKTMSELQNGDQIQTGISLRKGSS